MQGSRQFRPKEYPRVMGKLRQKTGVGFCLLFSLMKSEDSSVNFDMYYFCHRLKKQSSELKSSTEKYVFS